MNMQKKICPLSNCTYVNLEQIDSIFYKNSGKSFSNNDEKMNFKNKWLAPYFDNEKLFYCMIINGNVVGYINGDIKTENIHDEFVNFLQDFPAHLHINISQDFHGIGLGAELIKYFYEVLRENKIQGVHIVTSPISRNVKFYERNGHRFTRVSSCQRYLFMGKSFS